MTNDAEGALKFFDDELRRIKLELEKKEEQITAFKKSHIGELPQHMDASFRSLDRLESEINSVNESIQRHSDKLAMVEKAMQEYRLYGRQNHAFMTGSMEPDPLFARLKELREKQIKLKAEFRDEYPEVILTKEELRHVEEQLVELYGPDAIKPDKKPLDPYLQDLVKQESEEKSELNLSKQRLEILNASRKAHEKHVERSHEVEQDLLVLERDYGSMKANYATLLDKRLHARVAENMEKRQKSGKFRILDASQFSTSTYHTEQAESLGVGIFVRLCFGCRVVGNARATHPPVPWAGRRGTSDGSSVIGGNSRLLISVEPNERASTNFPNSYHAETTPRRYRGAPIGSHRGKAAARVSTEWRSLREEVRGEVFPALHGC